MKSLYLKRITTELREIILYQNDNQITELKSFHTKNTTSEVGENNSISKQLATEEKKIKSFHIKTTIRNWCKFIKYQNDNGRDAIKSFLIKTDSHRTEVKSLTVKRTTTELRYKHSISNNNRKTEVNHSISKQQPKKWDKYLLHIKTITSELR